MAFKQAPRPHPFQPVKFLSADWWRYPLERNAFKRLPSIISNLNDVFVLPSTDKLWAVGDGGMIVHSDDGGRTWVQQQVPVSRRSPVEGVFEGEPKQEEHKQQQVPEKAAFLKLPTLLPNAYAMEQKQAPAPPSQQQIQNSEVTIKNGKTVQAKEKKLPRQIPSSEPLSKPGSSVNPKQTGSPQPSSPPPPSIEPLQKSIDLYGVYFLNTEEGWIVGNKGIVLHTTDGGATWAPQTTGTQTDLISIQFLADGRQGWAAGVEGTILKTENGGQTWQGVVYRIGFAPWYYVIGWGFPLVLLFVALRQQEAITPVQESVADQLVSDRPLEAGDPDPLRFTAIARGLSRFLRNEKTQPPLTIAITGEWGTGKSSLMNLLKADLEGQGFRPVWFNAWHHQKEEQLLAALLESVRTQGIPRWWHRKGLRFRARLLWLRGWRHWFPLLLLLLIFCISAGYFAPHPHRRFTEAVRQARAGIEALYDWGKDLVQEKAGPMDLPQTPIQNGPGVGSSSLIILLTSLSGLLLALHKGLSAFGVTPASLLASVSGSVRIHDLQAQTGFRQQFAAEFRDVTQALKPYTMLILIDDLDRISRPEKVLEVLEAINFLVASGECFVVMGMALERVERCVGLGFQDVAAELMGGQEGNEQQGTAEAGRKKRAEFARQYLEKLVNIEVPVPIPTALQSAQLVTTEQPPATGFGSQRLARALVGAAKFWPGVMFALVLVGGFWFGYASDGLFGRAKESGTQSPEQAQAPGTEQPGRVVPPKPIQSAPPEKERDRPIGGPTFIPGQPGHFPMTQTFLPFLVLLAVGIWMLRNRSDVIVKDSPEFEEALRIWLPLILAKQNTPRSVKRFLNRVRYLAMRQRPQTQPDTAWEQLQSWIKQAAGFAQQNGIPAEPEMETIPESLLVALSAIYYGYSERIEVNKGFSPNMYELVKNENIWKKEQFSDGANQPRKVLQEASEAHEKRFGNLQRIDSYWNTFVGMSKGIHVRS